MKSRRDARQVAVQSFYLCDSIGDWGKEVVEYYFKVFHPNRTAEETKDYYRFCEELIDGVIVNLPSIDALILKAAAHWSIDRMSRLDRNILRLGTYEIALRSDIPPNVSINEAIEIAKSFGTDDSPMFVNGVLDRVARLEQDTPGIIHQLDSAGEPLKQLA